MLTTLCCIGCIQWSLQIDQSFKMDSQNVSLKSFKSIDTASITHKRYIQFIYVFFFFSFCNKSIILVFSTKEHFLSLERIQLKQIFLHLLEILHAYSESDSLQKYVGFFFFLSYSIVFISLKDFLMILFFLKKKKIVIFKEIDVYKKFFLSTI